VFLEWFAASGSVVWSAAKADVSYKTVWKHRMADPLFAAAFDRAQEQGVARAKALLLEGRRARKPIAVDGDWEAAELDDFDPALLAKIVFDHERRLARGPQRGKAPAAASNADVEAALAKRLALLTARARAKARAEGAVCPGCGRRFEARDEGDAVASGEEA
jgi:hypothetical protein